MDNSKQSPTIQAQLLYKMKLAIPFMYQMFEGNSIQRIGKTQVLCVIYQEKIDSTLNSNKGIIPSNKIMVSVQIKWLLVNSFLPLVSSLLLLCYRWKSNAPWFTLLLKAMTNAFPASLRRGSMLILFHVKGAVSQRINFMFFSYVPLQEKSRMGSSSEGYLRSFLRLDSCYKAQWKKTECSFVCWTRPSKMLSFFLSEVIKPQTRKLLHNQ